MRPRPSLLSPAPAALLLALVVRTAVGLSRLDELTFRFHTASVAVALLEGLPLRLHELPLISHDRGSAGARLLAVPLVALLGDTLVAIKLEAIALSGATAWLFARMLERGAGRTAAWAGALLFAFLPPCYQALDVRPLGSHVDTVLFDLAALALVVSSPRGADAGARRALALGLVAGLGLFFSSHFLVVLPALLAPWWAVDRRFWRRRSALGTAALVDPRVPLGQPTVRGSEFVHMAEPVRRAAKGDPRAELGWLARLDGDWAGFAGRAWGPEP